MGRYTSWNLTLALALLLALLGPPAPPAVVAASRVTPAAEEASYTLIDLGTFGGDSSRATAINEAGQVVVAAEIAGHYRSFLWQNGQVTDLGDLGGPDTHAGGINESGQVVGVSDSSEGTSRPFLWQNGQMSSLGDGLYSASDINDAGQIIGRGMSSPNALLWQNGQVTDLGALDDFGSQGYEINNAGQVVGWSYVNGGTNHHAFVWHNGQMTDLSPPGTLGAEAFAINDLGHVVGYSYINERHAVMWRDGQVLNLGNLGYLGDQGPMPFGINNVGQVVGYAYTVDGFNTAFLWQNGQMVDLQNLIAPDPGWQFYEAHDISDSGIIVGAGFRNGEQHAFVMVPSDPPSSTCTDPQVLAPPKGLQSRTFGSLLVRADSFTGSANWTATGTVWLGSNAVVEDASITASGGSLSGSGVVSMVTATGPERVTPLLKDSFSVSADGTLTPAAASGFELRLSRLGGFCVKPDRYQLGLDLARGVLTGSANLWLRVPEQPLVAKPFSFTLRGSGELSGQLVPPAFALFDLGLIDLKVTKATLGNDGITTKEASLILDAVVGGASVQLPDGAFRLTAEDGLATTIPVLLPNIRFGNPQPGQGVGGFGIEGVRATLSFGGGSYRFAGSGTLVLPGVASSSGCKIGASLELVSTAPTIREASFSIGGGCVKIPIGSTGAFITGFSGKATANETDIALDLTINFIYGDNIEHLGTLLSGTLGAHWDTTWTVGLNGTLKAYRWDAGSASLTLGPTDGLRGSLNLRALTVLEGNANIHAWQDGAGYHLTGHADVGVKVRAGGWIRACTGNVPDLCLLMPPADFSGPSNSADFGEFRTPLGNAYGLKGSLTAFGYTSAFFVDVDGNIAYDLGGLRDYQLVDQPASNLLVAGAVPDAVYTMTVDDAPTLIVGLAHDTGGLTLTLTDPNGRTIDAATVADDLFTSIVAGQTLYTVADPLPGTWTVRVGNRAGDEVYLLRALGATPAPQITQPPTPTPATNGYTIAFAGVAGPDATYSLFYDDDNSGNDGRPIAQGIPLSQSTVAWDTRTVPVGNYHIYAMLDDPAAAPAFAYSAAPVTISDETAPGIPTGVGATIAGDEATITWTPPLDLDLAGYRITYTEPGNGKTFTTDLPDPGATSYVQPGLALNGTWTIAVSAYDINGNESPPSAPASLPVVAYIAIPAPVGVSPAGGTTVGGTPVTITGLDFQPGATVTFSGIAATGVRVADAQTITATAPPHAAGLVAVVVANPGGGQGTLAAAYEYADPAAPTPFAVTLTTSGNCQATLSPGGPYAADATVTAQVAFDAVTTAFVGWELDGTPIGWANPLAFSIAGASHTLAATCVPRPTFGDLSPGDPAREAILQLAARGSIRGYANGNFGSSDGVQRAQMAALIARATPLGPGTPPTTLVPPSCLVAGSWDCESWGTTFADQRGLDPNLWRNVGTLQHYGVAFGYDGAACAARGVASPCYGPTEAVSHAQTIAFIARAMIAKSYWVAQPNAPLPHAGVPAVLATEVRTFHFYTGGLPPLPAGEGWNDGADRGWFARALWSALDAYWGDDRAP